MRTHAPTTTDRFVTLVGAESSGKSTLAAALAGTRPRATNLPGSTIQLERLSCADGTVLVDTPGLLHRGDTPAAQRTLAWLDEQRPDATTLLVARATHLDDELATLLPLVAGRRGVLAVTGWDRVEETAAARRAVRAVAAAVGVPAVTLDARETAGLPALSAALAAPGRFTDGPLLVRTGWRIEPPPTVLERRVLGPPLGLALLLAPAVAAVAAAWTVAGLAEGPVESAGEQLAAASSSWPTPLPALLAGDYGLGTMVPLLVVWALPAVTTLALLLGALKASGLLDRLTTAVHPLVRPFGLTGRDLVRVVAGAGCNVPAVLAARSCSSCSQVPTTGAIAFASPCSYQPAAALAVLAAAGRPLLLLPYLVVLLAGGLLHARWLTPTSQRTRGGHLDLHLLHGRAFLVRPRWRDVRREATTTLHHAAGRALPTFLAIAAVASLLAEAGVLDRAARVAAPLLAGLRLPADAALPIVLASVRKDGALLLAPTADVLDAGQLLAALLLAGALLPCLVTAWTIAREQPLATTARLLGRQAVLALTLAAAVSWTVAVWP